MSVQSEINRIAGNITAAYTAIADKGGTVPSSKVSKNLVSAINTIPIGVTVQRTSGYFTTDSSGKATVNCGFQPDLVAIEPMRTIAEDYNYYFTFPFEATNNGSNEIDAAFEHINGIVYTGGSRTKDGFVIRYMNDFGWDLNSTVVANTRCTYTAVKYT